MNINCAVNLLCAPTNKKVWCKNFVFLDKNRSLDDDGDSSVTVWGFGRDSAELRRPRSLRY